VANSIIAALTAKWQETADFRAFTVYVTGASGPLSARCQVLLQVITTCSPKGFTTRQVDKVLFTHCCWDASQFAKDFRWDKNNGTTARTLGVT
jgi:phosphoribosyl 1,2-cyclic phosphodiesterase